MGDRQPKTESEFDDFSYLSDMEHNDDDHNYDDNVQNVSNIVKSHFIKISCVFCINLIIRDQLFCMQYENPPRRSPSEAPIVSETSSVC